MFCALFRLSNRLNTALDKKCSLVRFSPSSVRTDWIKWKTEYVLNGKLSQKYSYQKLLKSDNPSLCYNRKCLGCFFGIQYVLLPAIVILALCTLFSVLLLLIVWQLKSNVMTNQSGVIMENGLIEWKNELKVFHSLHLMSLDGLDNLWTKYRALVIPWRSLLVVEFFSRFSRPGMFLKQTWSLNVLESDWVSEGPWKCLRIWFLRAKAATAFSAT